MLASSLQPAGLNQILARAGIPKRVKLGLSGSRNSAQLLREEYFPLASGRRTDNLARPHAVFAMLAVTFIESRVTVDAHAVA